MIKILIIASRVGKVKNSIFVDLNIKLGELKKTINEFSFFL